MIKSPSLRLILVLLTLIFILVITGCTSQTSPTISSFEECVAAGGLILESYPEKCETADGRTFTKNVIPEIPIEALVKYDELKSQYSESMGAALERCEGPDRIFRVSGSGGYTVIFYYYSNSGQFLGDGFMSDVPVESKDPPVDLSKYTCTVIKRSKQPG